VLLARLLAAVYLVSGACTTARSPVHRDGSGQEPRPVERLAYGSNPLQFGDLRLPAGLATHAPVAIVVHGGCWRSSIASLGYMDGVAEALRTAGFATWNVEYRGADVAGGGWPGTFTDVAAAADHVRELARRYPIDAERAIAIGHSAGGHLALWLAARRKLPPTNEIRGADPLPLRAVVDLAGPGDLREVAGRVADICGGPVLEDLLGGGPGAVPERWAAASPIALLPLGVRQVLVAGVDDVVMPPAVRDAYAAAAREAGDAAESVGVQGGHREVVAPGSQAWGVAIARILELARDAPSESARRPGTRP
jgi:acetyl esterase/lipase